MIFSIAIWLLIWGGMFTGIFNLRLPRFTSNPPLSIFQGLRALFPLLALFLTLLRALYERTKFYAVKSPLGLLCGYAAVGIPTSFLLSVDTEESLYWVGVYIAPLILICMVMEHPGARREIESLMRLNYVIFFVFALYFFPEAVRVFLGRESFSAFYKLPFGLGDVTKNGAGRYALLTVVVSFVRFMTQKNRRRFLWLLSLLPAAFLLMMTQSRTSLLGLAVVGLLFIPLWGIDWRLIFSAPAAAYLLWLSGIKWRAQGRLDHLWSLTGRELTWNRAFDQIERSPFLGWGFNADRIMLRAEHMHNAWLHSLIQTGIVGFFFFLGGFVWMWWLIIRTHLIRHLRRGYRPEDVYVVEAILILGFMTSRSFFESTAAFFGVDLLFLVPAMALIILSLETLPSAAGDAPAEPQRTP